MISGPQIATNLRQKPDLYSNCLTTPELLTEHI